MLARSVGVVDLDLEGRILLLEVNRAAGLGMVDRALTQLRHSGALDGVAGVALGSIDQFAGYEDRGWTVLDTLRDHLDALGVPVLGGLPIGHIQDLVTVPLGTHAAPSNRGGGENRQCNTHEDGSLHSNGGSERIHARDTQDISAAEA